MVKMNTSTMKPEIKLDLFAASPVEITTGSAIFNIISRLRDGDKFESIVTVSDRLGLISSDTILWDGNDHHNQLQMGDDYYDLQMEIEEGRPQLYIRNIN